MKHKGSICQTYLKRDTEVLPLLFRKARNMASYPTTMQQLCCIAAKLPTPFFCIADDAALDYVRKRHLHGKTKSFLSPYKQQLFDAFWSEFAEIRRTYPRLTLQDCVWMALARPAPCIGLTPSSIQFKISCHLRK